MFRKLFNWLSASSTEPEHSYAYRMGHRAGYNNLPRRETDFPDQEADYLRGYWKGKTDAIPNEVFRHSGWF